MLGVNMYGTKWRKSHPACLQREDLRRKRTLQWSEGSCTISKRVEEFFRLSSNFHGRFIFTSYLKRILIPEARYSCPRFLLIERKRNATNYPDDDINIFSHHPATSCRGR